MREGFIVLIVVTGLIWMICAPLNAVQVENEGLIIVPDKAAGKITIDGNLDEAVWKQPPINQPFKTYSPVFGDVLTEKTKVWAAFDKKNIYFAFYCLDSQPGKIKTSIAQRDNIYNDDYVGILLDAAAGRQTSVEFVVNPNGIQGDSGDSAVNVAGPDQTVDFVWESAGKMMPDGYVVEIRIPRQSLRFQGGKQVKMRAMFVRQINRLGVKASWPEVKAGSTKFPYMTTLVYKGLKKGLRLEILPNVTYSRNQDRRTRDDWDTESDTNIGVAVKYGITSSITAEATVNPDFSQVESDAFQVEVNQRYPVFYSEKRPFFMESKEVLDFGLVRWGMLVSPVHTRTIVDPGWAVKFSGSEGKMNFALLAANDRSPGRSWPAGTNPDEGKSALFGVVRAKYNIGGDNSLGVLYSGRHFAGQSNNVAGADLKYQLSKYLRGTLSFLHSSTRDDDGEPVRNGASWNAMLRYVTPKVSFMFGYERYGKDFEMATAFLNRTAIERVLVGGGVTMNVKSKSFSWLKSIMPYGYYLNMRDLNTGIDDKIGILGVTINFAPLGFANFEYYREDEGWAGQVFAKNYFVGSGGIQVARWLKLNGSFNIGDALYYDPYEPFMGNGRSFSVGATFQPDVKVNVGISYVFNDLKRKNEDEAAYTVNIYNFRATYQFNKYFFVRGIVRYNSYQQRVLTDALASFTLIPGTVVHLGYGALYLKNRWNHDHWVPGQGDYLQMKRGLFFKASYLWRFD